MSSLGRPWQRWETWLAIAALFLVSGSLLPWWALARIVCASVAFGLVLVLFGLRFGVALLGKQRR